MNRRQGLTGYGCCSEVANVYLLASWPAAKIWLRPVPDDGLRVMPHHNPGQQVTHSPLHTGRGPLCFTGILRGTGCRGSEALVSVRITQPEILLVGARCQPRASGLAQATRTAAIIRPLGLAEIAPTTSGGICGRRRPGWMVLWFISNRPGKSDGCSR